MHNGLPPTSQLTVLPISATTISNLITTAITSLMTILVCRPHSTLWDCHCASAWIRSAAPPPLFSATWMPQPKPSSNCLDWNSPPSHVKSSHDGLLRPLDQSRLPLECQPPITWPPTYATYPGHHEVGRGAANPALNASLGRIGHSHFLFSSCRLQARKRRSLCPL